MIKVVPIVLLWGAISFGSFFSDAPGSEELRTAYRRYLENDRLGMLSAIRHQMEKHPGDDFGNRNALDLLEKAFTEAGGRGIPLDWHLPREISVLFINERRLEQESGPAFQLQAAGYSEYGAILQLRIDKVPGRTLIDRRRGIGRWNEFGPGRRDADFSFKYFSPEFRQPIGPGLFHIGIEMKSGKKIQGWFVMSGPSASRGPRIISPAAKAQLFTRKPTVRWEDFGSLEYFSFERRHCLLKIIPEENQLTRWSFAFGDESSSRRLRVPPTKATVGKEGEIVGGSELDLGKYLSYLRCDSIRREGDLLLSRENLTFAPFTVLTPLDLPAEQKKLNR